MYKTYYDITLVTISGDNVNIKGLTNSQLNSLTTNESLVNIIINKQYDKKLKR